MKIPVISPEVWKAIPGCTGYEASSHGRIRSYRSPNGRGALVTQPRLMALSPMKDKPYLQVTLSMGAGKYYQAQVHCLILLTFVGPKLSSLLEGCHNDGNARNNFADNLRWDTKQSNAADQIKHGTKPLGSKSHLAVLTDDQVMQIKAAFPNWKHGTGKYFADLFKVGTTTISNIKREIRWRHL